MKKLISLVLALTLVLAAVPAFAEEAETEYRGVLEWETYAGQIRAAGIQGKDYTLEGINVAFWVPPYLQLKEPEDRAKTYRETGMLGAFESEEGDMGFIISLYGMPVKSMDEYIRAIDEAGAEDGRRYLINGLDAYSYVYDNVMILAFLAGEEGVLLFSFYTNTDERFITDASIIAASIRLYDPQQEE